jgi:hypothetical protein
LCLSGMVPASRQMRALDCIVDLTGTDNAFTLSGFIKFKGDVVKTCDLQEAAGK